MLDYERLDVYQCAMEFLAIAARLMAAMPRGYGSLTDQLRRASLSIPLNIAEGSGKTEGRDRAHFMRIARGSAMECGAILDASRILHLGSPDDLDAGKRLALTNRRHAHQDVPLDRIIHSRDRRPRPKRVGEPRATAGSAFADEA